MSGKKEREEEKMISKSATKIDRRIVPPSELKVHNGYKKSGVEMFNIILRHDIRQVKATNEVLTDISKSRCIEQLRTVFADYTSYCPPYSMIEEGIEEHCKECPLATHWFFEAEAVCMSNISSTVGSSNLIATLLDCYNFIQHLPKKQKKEIIQENLFKMERLDIKTVRFYLTPPHYEYNVNALIIYLQVNRLNNYVSKLHFDNYKAALTGHLNKCRDRVL